MAKSAKNDDETKPWYWVLARGRSAETKKLVNPNDVVIVFVRPNADCVSKWLDKAGYRPRMTGVYLVFPGLTLDRPGNGVLHVLLSSDSDAAVAETCRPLSRGVVPTPLHRKQIVHCLARTQRSTNTQQGDEL